MNDAEKYLKKLEIQIGKDPNEQEALHNSALQAALTDTTETRLLQCKIRENNHHK